MTTTFSDSTDLQGIFEHTKYLSGQSNLAIKDFTRLANFAMDDYSSIVFSADGKWKFDDSTKTTNPTGYTQVTAGQRNYELSTNFLVINRVEIKIAGKYRVLDPIDERDFKGVSLETQFETDGTPRWYDYDGSNIKLYPSPNFTDSGTASTIANNSLKVEHTKPASYFDVTDTTTAIGIPRVHHEYIALKATEKVMLASNDPSITNIRSQLVSWEGLEQQGRLSGGKIREYYTIRDENTPRRIRPKVDAAFASSSGFSRNSHRIIRNNLQ